MFMSHYATEVCKCPYVGHLPYLFVLLLCKLTQILVNIKCKIKFMCENQRKLLKKYSFRWFSHEKCYFCVELKLLIQCS